MKGWQSKSLWRTKKCIERKKNLKDFICFNIKVHRGTISGAVMVNKKSNFGFIGHNIHADGI